jgi:hypothetical protein
MTVGPQTVVDIELYQSLTPLSPRKNFESQTKLVVPRGIAASHHAS